MRLSRGRRHRSSAMFSTLEVVVVYLPAALSWTERADSVADSIPDDPVMAIESLPAPPAKLIFLTAGALNW